MNSPYSSPKEHPHKKDRSATFFWSLASGRSISVARGIILRANNKTSPFLRTLVDCLDDVYQFLLVLQNPVQLVIVASAKVAHHMFVAEEEHEGDSVVKL